MILPPHSTDDMCERFHCLFLDLFAYCGVIVVFNVVINYEVVGTLSNV